MDPPELVSLPFGGAPQENLGVVSKPSDEFPNNIEMTTIFRDRQFGHGATIRHPGGRTEIPRREMNSMKSGTSPEHPETRPSFATKTLAGRSRTGIEAR